LPTLLDAITVIDVFRGKSLTQHIATIERSLMQVSVTGCKSICDEQQITPDLLQAVITVKLAAAQIDVVLHAVGILVSLPRLLREGEVIETLSLGAGNTGKPFDLETNLRVAEFKFIDWKGGPESIRQNTLFKDFYLLAEAKTSKERFLYVNDATRPLRFLNGGRALSSVLSHESKLWTKMNEKYPHRFSVVREYYEYRKDLVTVVDLGVELPELWARVGRLMQEGEE
jgi:hypothetical protein